MDARRRKRRVQHREDTARAAAADCCKDAHTQHSRFREGTVPAPLDTSSDVPAFRGSLKSASF